jgi:hypothetical protein
MEGQSNDDRVTRRQSPRHGGPDKEDRLTWTHLSHRVPASIGTVGDSYDNAMAELVMGIFKTELHRNQAVLADNGGHWKGLRSDLGDRTPLEIEAEYGVEHHAKVA